MQLQKRLLSPRQIKHGGGGEGPPSFKYGPLLTPICQVECVISGCKGDKTGSFIAEVLVWGRGGGRIKAGGKTMQDGDEREEGRAPPHPYEWLY